MKYIRVLIGTRPEAIKLCPLISELRKRPDCLVTVCTTGQHRELLENAMGAFGIVPDVSLSVMEPQQSLGRLTGRMLTLLDNSISADVPPDWLVVQGDTATAFAGALTGFYRKIPVAHVEAGLRTPTVDSPFPEEMHRRLISKLSAFHFAPTEEARRNLLAEGIPADTVFLTGNTVVDALQYTLRQKIGVDDWIFPSCGKAVLFTAHRRENQQDMESLFNTLGELAKNHPEITVVFPVHPNPTLQALSHRVLQPISNIRLITPPDVVSFHRLLSKVSFILTDSGGIQEEATALGIPTLVLRDSTERTEGIRAGCLKLVGTDRNSVLSHCEALLLPDSPLHRQMSRPSHVYGMGNASALIADILCSK